MISDLSLIEPDPRWQSAFLDMAAELAASGDGRYRAALADFSAYCQRLTDDARGDMLPAGRVRQTTYWGVADAQLVGCIHLRHDLTPALRQIGGHIGYVIRPAKRGHGYGTALLSQTLDRARHMGLTRVLLTCDTDNLASARVIEKNGGQFQEQSMVAGYTKMIARYWIDLSAAQ